MVEVKLIDKKGDWLTFLIKKASPAYINTLRRTILDEVPTMAIEEVEFRKNDSILYDELVAHRLGLIPLSTDLKSYNLPEKCTCEGTGCAKCQLDLTLKTKASGVIDASKLKSKDPKVKPIHDDMIITKLTEGQELEFAAKACLGRGKVHAKWSPGHAFFKQKPIINILKADQTEAAVNACPVNVFDLKGNKAAVNKSNEMKCHLCQACVEACPRGAIEVYGAPDEFIFSVESWGQLKPKEVVSQAVVEFIEKLDEFSKLVGELSE
ncbi:DNA-directed RNA polymerase subunit D [Candidatus Woesearchaeota archaeon]|nr:DNA-directed RNA polymerase subunit D [Candidatus Woesearchaeota archaeon]